MAVRMRLLRCALLASAFAALASASPMFQVDYNLNLGDGTLHGNWLR